MKDKKNSNIIAIIGFIFSIISIPTLGLISIVGLILSIVGLAISKKYNKPLKGLSISGIIISSIMLLIFWILFISYLNSPAVPADYTSNKSTNASSTTSSTSDTKKVKEYVVPDFSTMTESEANTWCKTNGANCYIFSDYSEEVESGHLIEQGLEPGTTTKNDVSVIVKYSLGHKETLGESNAIKKGKDYLRVMAFSRDGLIRQLEYEGYSTEEANYAVDRCGADWNEQAGKKAKEYISVMAFSREGLINQLEYEGFTYEQAVYGVTQVGY